MASIQGIYLALFGRPADPAGLAYYNGATNSGADLSGIGNLAGQKEYIDRFAGMGSAQIVQSIYQSLFGRAGEQAGVDFWVGRLASGALNINNIAIAILDGASGSDKATVDAKIAAADLFTSHLDLPAEQKAYDASTVGRARDYIATIDETHPGTASAVDALIAQLQASAGQAPANGGDNGGSVNPPAQVHGVSLTVLDADHVSPNSQDPATQTTSADDIITVSDAYHAVGTIDGGSGFDTLVITTDGTVSAPSGSIQNIERLDIHPSDVFNVVDLHNVEGLKEISVIGQTAEVDGISKSVTTIHLMGDVGLLDIFSFRDTSGTDDTITLNPVDFHMNTFRSVGIELPGFEHVIVDVGSESEIHGLSDVNLKTLSFVGKGNLIFQDINIGAQALVIDASGHTGDTAISINQRALDTSVTFVGGNGSDIFAATGGNLTMTGGAGADVFKVDWTSDGQRVTDMDVITDFDPSKDTLVLGVKTHSILLETSLSQLEQSRIATAANLDGFGGALSAVSSAGFDHSDLDGSWAIEFVYRNDTYVYSENGNAKFNLIKLTGISDTIDPQHLIIHTWVP